MLYPESQAVPVGVTFRKEDGHAAALMAEDALDEV